MDNLNLNYSQSNSEYNSGWQSLSEPVAIPLTEDETEHDRNEEIKQADDFRTKRAKHPVLTIQLILSLCALLFLFIVKFLSQPLFGEIMTWYNSQLNQSVIYNGDFKNNDFSFLIATQDEV